MAEKTITLYGAAAAVVKGSAPATHFSAGTTVTLDTGEDLKLLIAFAAPDAAYRYCRLSKYDNELQVYVSAAPEGSRQVGIYCASLLNPVEMSTVTYQDVQEQGFGELEIPSWDDPPIYTVGNAADKLALRNGVVLDAIGSNRLRSVETPSGTHKPYLKLTVDTADLVGLSLASAAPSAGYVDRTAAVEFRWSVVPDGDCYGDVAQTAATFRWRQGASGTVHEISCGTAGSWSDAAQVIVIAPPAQPGVTVQEESPRPVLQWTSTGQQGYEVEIGDYHSGTVFGPDQRWRCPELLPDGQYVARVRVVNTYGLWSAWGSTPLTVSHTAGAAITLQVSAGHKAELSWSTSGAYDRYIVLRDGKPIAKVKARSYTDHRSLGAVTYQVMGLPAEGYDYGRSNAVTCEISAGTLMLCDLDAGEWHALGLSDQQHRQFTESLTQTVTRVSLAGRAYPVAEKTPWHDRSISITWAHNDPLLLAKYDALEGKAVCIKTPGGRMVCGILDSLQRTEGVFYTAYSATVWQLDDSEVIDYDP